MVLPTDVLDVPPRATVPPVARAPHAAPVGRLWSQRPSLVLTPAVVAHRGASGYRPEHTLEAYRLAIRMGADDIELDLVPTADGVLVARHDGGLGRTTDVADHAQFAHRRTTRIVDGSPVTDWFVEDFTLAEVTSLRARERMVRLRPRNTAYDGRLAIPTLDEVLALAADEGRRRGREVGVMAEIKHATYFASVGLPVEVPLVAALGRHGLDHPKARVVVKAFETAVLRRLAGMTRVGLVQLLMGGTGRPADFAAAGDARTWSDLASPSGLDWIDDYADGISVERSMVLPCDGAGRRLGPSPLVREAHRRWLTVHVWTLRSENRFLPADVRRGDDPSGYGDAAADVRAFLSAGVDGIITDHPDTAVEARAGWLADR